jgi:guanosine-3',5'-bis(diphosphate) 3'-pyrophosphohydrolase
MTDGKAIPESRLLYEAIAFAARAHQGQMRKDGVTPYVSHAFRVCMVLRDLFNVTDMRTLTAAVLHDTVEDTTTDYDDLLVFGADVARWVALLSKDKRQPEDQREEAYLAGLVGAPWQVRLCKLADMYDNLSDIATLDSRRKNAVVDRVRSYHAGLKPAKPDETSQAWEKVAELLKSGSCIVQ